jgi:RNA 2',3'-cyclic 3'-phosphodiesterase
MRLFLAISPSEQARAALASACERVRSAAVPGVRVVASHKLHITLQFLGGSAPERVAELGSACREAAARVSPFEIELRGAGAFPSVQRAKILWLGVGRGTGPLQALEQALTRATAACGFPREARVFHPHATLAYVKQPLNVSNLVRALDDSLPEVTLPVREAQLIRSHTEQGGARYELLAAFPLGGAR